MSTRAKRIKLDQDETEGSAGSPDLTKMLPSEVIEKIISFVPLKLNCFLVNKDFQREAINATRNKCILNLSPNNLVSKGLMETRWVFDEIRLASEICMDRYERENKSLQKCRDQAFDVFKKFGSQVKKLSIFNVEIHELDLLHLLTLLPNLVELHVQNCRPTEEFDYFLTSPNGIADFPKLEKITIIGTWFSTSLSWLDRISCPIIQDFRVHNFDSDSPSAENFYQRHNQIKNIELKGFYFYSLSLEHLELSELSVRFSRISKDQVATTIESQQNLKKLSLKGASFMTDRLLQKIGMLQYLESLDIFIQIDEVISKPIIEEIMQICHLKSLEVSTYNINFISTLLEAESLQLEELSINWKFSHHPYCSLPKLGDIAEKFPNLKKLSLSSYHICRNDFNKLLQLEKLKSIKLQFSLFNENSSLFVTNTSIRELDIRSHEDGNTIRLLKVMPNLEKLTIDFPRQQGENRKIIEAALNLKRLRELTSSLRFLRSSEVVTVIMEHQENTKLERIIINVEEGEIVYFSAAYKAQFPVIHINHKERATITMSRM